MSPVLLIATMCFAQVIGMLGFFSFAALLPGFIDEWQLSNTDAGWISGIFFGGYTIVVPVLTSLTDRVDAKRIYLFSMAVSVVAAFGFAIYAEDFWTAMLFRALAGIGMAGTYMPGLKLLGDHIGGEKHSRAVAFYTSSFGIGTALSFLIAGEVGDLWGWPWAFAIGGSGACLAFLLVALALPPSRAHHEHVPETHLLDFRPVLRNRSSLAFTICYTVHNWEAFGLRSWVVAFLAFTATLQGGEVWGMSPVVIATTMSLLGVWSGVTGNELSLRFGRRRAVFGIMLVSAMVAGVIGFTSSFSYALAAAFCLLHGVMVSGESASVTAGAIGNARPAYRGATMAMHSTLGFAGSFMGPVAVGLVLDLAGGESVMGYGIAFASMGVVMLVGPLTIALMRPDELPGDGARRRQAAVED